MDFTDTATRALDAIAGRHTERRRFLAYAGGAAAGAGALSLLSGCGSDSATTIATQSGTQVTISDIDILNFALNLEYLEAQYYAFATTGVSLSSSYLTGPGTLGTVTGGAQVSFTDPLVAQYAREIAADELDHVNFLRTILNSNVGNVAVAMPAINIDGTASTGAFAQAAQAAGIAASDGTFNPYASDENFLLGAFLLEDVGVTAYKGATILLSNKTYLENFAGIMATEAYHAGLIRSVLYRKGIELDPTIFASAQAISDARDSLDGSSDDDQGIGTATVANITPADGNALAYTRTSAQVLNVVYLNKAAVKTGGFFPSGVNGNIYTSAAYS